MAIQIDSISHKVGDVYASTKDYLYGNIGDKVTTVVTFTTDAAIAAVDFYFGLVDNNTDYYPNDNLNPASYQIPLGLFNNGHTGQVQKYTGTTSSMNPAFKATETGSCVLANVAGNQYTLTLIHRINPFVEPENKNGNNYVKTDFANPLRFLCQIDAKTDALDPTIPTGYSTSEVDCSSVFKKGTTGTFGEQFSTGITPLHTLTTFTISTPGTELDPNQDSPCSGQITTTGADYTTSTKLFLRIQKVKEATDFEQTDTYLTNTEFEEVSLTANGTPVNGTYLKSVTASVNGGNAKKIDFTFTVDADYFGGDEEDYALYFSVANNTTPDHNNVLLSLSTSDAVADTTVFAETGEITFGYHYNKTRADGFNHVKSMIEDRLIAWFDFQNTDSNRTTVNSIQIGCKRSTTGQVLESVTVLSSEIPYDSDRPFQVDAGDLWIRREVSVVDGGVYTPTDTYSIVYGFQIWTNFVQFTDVVLFVRVNFTQSGITDFKEWQSPNFEIYSYELPQNTGAALDPIVTFSDIKLLNPADSSEVKKIIRDGYTLVRAEFSANQNDLIAEQEDLTGYIGVGLPNGSQNIYFQAHVNYGWKTGAPFAKITGETTETPTLTKITDGTGKIEVQIYEPLLRTLLPQTATYRISARIDRQDPPSAGFGEISWHFQIGASGISQVLDLSTLGGETLRNLSYVEIFASLGGATLTFQYDTSTTFATGNLISTTNFVTFASAIAGKATGYIRMITSATGFVDGGIIFRYTLSAVPPAAENVIITIPADALGTDFIIWFDKRVQINSITESIGGDNQYFALRTLEPSGADYGTFPYTNLAGINGAIAALSEGDKYGIHILNEQTTDLVRTLDITVEFLDATLKRVVKGFITQQLDNDLRTATQGNALDFAGTISGGAVDDYLEVNSMATLDNTDIFTVICVWDSDSLATSGGVGQALCGFGSATAVANAKGWFLIPFNDNKVYLSADAGTGALQYYLQTTNTFLKTGRNIVIYYHNGSYTLNGDKFWLNGKRGEATLGTPVNASWIDGTSKFYVGGDPRRVSGATEPLRGAFNGRMRGLEILNRAITDEEAREIYLRGTARGVAASGDFLLDVDFNKNSGAPTDDSSNAYTITKTGTGAYQSFY